MPRVKALPQISDSVRCRLLAFISEQEPFAEQLVEGLSSSALFDPLLSDTLKKMLLSRSLMKGDPLPFRSFEHRMDQAAHKLAQDIQDFLKREAVKDSISRDEKRWLFSGMVLSRAVDNALKKLFSSGEMQYEGRSFQGKGFRSLGQEAIYGAALRLKRGSQFRTKERYQGDLVGPLIRDLGVFLAFTDNDVLAALNAQAGKEGPPLSGLDFHLGDLSKGVMTQAAPLAISTCTLLGMAMAIKERKENRVAISFIGEGGSSLGEWHEAINLAASHRLPMVFCLENNQIALSTSVKKQSAVRTFADKGAGYGIPGISIDGNDIEEVAAAFSWAADYAREGKGPVLLELITMRMCGHAHHDDMVYLGYEPELSLSLCEPAASGYVDHKAYAQWKEKDPIATYEAKLLALGVLSQADVVSIKEDAKKRLEEAVSLLRKRAWPSPKHSTEQHVFQKNVTIHVKKTLEVEPVPPFSSTGKTYLEGICEGVRQSFERYPQARVIGEDVGPPYGNAFMLFRPLLEQYEDRFINTPISENAIIGACVGMAISGMRPIGEMQFNDFIACGFNELANNAAKVFYRTRLSVPMVLRMPYGGLRRAGPYHSQDTSPWFYRTPGLKIVAPSTPFDACSLLVRAVEDPDPVLFYEHIALYRKPEIKQKLPLSVAGCTLGQGALRRAGRDLSIVSYGAYVHEAMVAATELKKKKNIEADVIDLRSLMPLDMPLMVMSLRKTGRILFIGEDSKRGSILESIASQIADTYFDLLDAPVRVLGSLNTPVPYSPPLEDAFLLSQEMIQEAASALVDY